MQPLDTAPVAPAPGEGSPHRMEGLNDGVFAIVMTLIVLEVRVPPAGAADLLGELGKVVPTLLTHALTFVTLGVLWFGNRTQSEFIHRATHALVWLNLAFLGIVALVPFSAAVLGRYPTRRLAVVVYGVHLTIASLAHGVCWIYATYHPEVLRSGISDRYRRLSRWASLSPALGYATATLVGSVAPMAGLVGFLLVPLPFVSGYFYRRLARLGTGRADEPPTS
jgi:uncharacterized membrane protein